MSPKIVFGLFIVCSASLSVQAIEYIVRFKNSGRAQQNLQLLKDSNLLPTDQIPQLDMFVVSSEPDDAGLQKIRQNQEVLYVEKNNLISLTDTKPNDSSFRKQWHHQNIHSTKAWDVTTGSKDIVVAVVDTGISFKHDDLKNNIWTNAKEIPANGIDDDQNGYIDDVKGWNFASNNNNPEDDQSHGSHCAGLIGAEGNNKIGTVGVNWKVKLMPLKFITSAGTGKEADGIKAIIYAADNGARIISASWGDEESDSAMHDAIDYAGKKGVLFVAAAGNNSSNTDKHPFYPSGYDLPNLIAVGASTSTNGVASFSNYAPVSVHIASPGDSIFSTSFHNIYETKSGTSMATPIVAGVAALVLATKPDLNVTELRNAVLNSAAPIKSWKTSAATGGLVQADAAVLQLAGGPQVWPKQMRIKVGAKLIMTAYKSTKPIWSSTNSKIATVDVNGVVTGLAAGATQINLIDDSGATHSASLEVK